METNTLQINKINRTIGSMFLRIGIMKLRDAQSDFSDTEDKVDKIVKALLKTGNDIIVSQKDETFFFTSFDNWLKIIETINPITQQFVWVKERFDCDNRAYLASTLISVLFELNTCNPVYCEVYNNTNGAFVDRHYANLITDDADNVYLWDADNQGQFSKITSATPVIGNWKYKLIKVEPF